MVLFHGNEATSTPENTWFAFSETPADTPRDTGRNGSDAIDDVDVANNAFPFAWTSEFLPPMIMAKTKARIKTPEKTLNIALLGGMRLAEANSRVWGPSGRGMYEHGTAMEGSSCFEKSRDGSDSNMVLDVCLLTEEIRKCSQKMILKRRRRWRKARKLSEDRNAFAHMAELWMSSMLLSSERARETERGICKK